MTEAAAPAKKSTALNYALDYGPLIAFFIAYKFGGSESDPTQGPLVGTGVFMVAIAIAESHSIGATRPSFHFEMATAIAIATINTPVPTSGPWVGSLSEPPNL